MVRIKNVSPYGDLDVPLLGRIVGAGETVKVDEAHAEILLQQAENFVPADLPTDPPAAPVNPESEQQS